ncbi:MULTISPECIES: hypothetical protein [unclassified Kitasatospora]|uniref:hypothetical protein n=1 Tax=unclassified Kitasatospora TaxID=2633591 RepID=UPI0033E22AA2
MCTPPPTRPDEVLGKGTDRTIEETCERLLCELRHPGDHGDGALLVARVRPDGSGHGPS